jgi:hypothetical protein
MLLQIIYVITCYLHTVLEEENENINDNKSLLKIKGKRKNKSIY